MSVFQVEEYYIHISIPKDKIHIVENFLNQNQPVCTESEWFGDDLTVTNFDSEGFANDFNKRILELLGE